MQRVTCFVMSLHEAENILRFQTGDHNAELVPEKWCNFYACATEGRHMSAQETDMLFARYFDVSQCTHYMGDEDEIIILVNE